MRFKLTPQARLDLKEIAEYLSSEASVERSLKVINQLRDEFHKSGDMPGMGHYREELLKKDYRFWSLHSYVIAYRWKTKPIQIIAVLHGARDLSALLPDR